MHINNRNHQHSDAPQGRRSLQRTRFEQSRTALLLALSLVALLLYPSLCFGQVIMRDDLTLPLIENEPFDLLTLDGSNMNAVVRILPPEDLILPLPEKGELVFEFAEDGELPLEVPYAAIVKYETFNELLLVEANAMMDKDHDRRSLRHFVLACSSMDARSLRMANTKLLFQFLKISIRTNPTSKFRGSTGL